MTSQVSIGEAQTTLREIIAGLGPDEEVVITENRQPVARIVGGHPRTRRPRSPGNCKGMIALLIEDDEHLKDFEEYMP